jgi:hypothetical protein
MFTDRTRIILCQEVTIVDVEHTLMLEPFFLCLENGTLKELMCSVIMFWALAKLHH